MIRNYNVFNIQDLGQKIPIKASRTFSSKEEFLKHVISQIQNETDQVFHQFLFLVDVLYVITYSKSELGYQIQPQNISSEIKAHYESINESSPKKEKGKTPKSGVKVMEPEKTEQSPSINFGEIQLPWKK